MNETGALIPDDFAERIWYCDEHDGDVEFQREKRLADVFVEWDEEGSVYGKYAGVFCNECATLLRSNIDPHDQDGDFRQGPIIIVAYRSVSVQKRLVAESWRCT